MRSCRPLILWGSMLIGAMIVLTGCTYDAAIQRLSPAEQVEFSTYRQVMTGAQTHTYLAKASAAERTAYLSEIGLTQRFQRLDPADRAAVQNGAPSVGMSAEALRFVWGDPYKAEGDPRHSARWQYPGLSFGRSSSYSYRPWDLHHLVEVYLADGKVVGWVDTVPADFGGEGDRRQQ